MKQNMGKTDRTIRILAAILIATLYFTNIITGTLAYVLAAIGGIFLLTSLVGLCPLYSVFGFTTCPKNK